jgi:hypothetical protein
MVLQITFLAVLGKSLETPRKTRNLLERQEGSNLFNTFILFHNKLLYVGVVPCFSLHGKAVPTL